MIRYRDATADDAEALAAFAAASFIDTFGHLYPPEDLTAFLAASHTSALYAGFAKSDDVHLRVATRSGAIVGYSKTGAVELHVDDAVQCRELHRLYVDTSVKGAGVARALMDDVFAWSREQRAPALYLGVWENNHRAQTFYKRLGFVHVGEHDFMVGQTRDRDFIWRLAL
ncbi:acetyltransferase, GNAT family [alpha proteobacterium U9-1i]|nr:acetyltransferase, GNAT family [alpha proteobacterium U9-1i]